MSELSETTTVRRRTIMDTKRHSREELVDIPLLDEESGDSGIVDGRVDLECDVEAVSETAALSVIPAKETRLTILLQVSLPFLFAGLGCVLAGLLLDVVEVSMYLPM